MLQYSDDYKHAEIDGYKFTRDERTGYYLSSKNMNGRRKRLHVYIWEQANGLVPKGFEIHHKDGDKRNNNLSNFELLNRSEHKIEHVHMMTDEQKKQVINNLLENVMPLAKKWHSSKEGLEWHRKNGIKVMSERPYTKYKCNYCGKEFESKKIYKETENKFCSNNCKSAFRRKSGVDNVIKICEGCGNEYTANKYQKTKYCENCQNKKSRTGSRV